MRATHRANQVWTAWAVAACLALTACTGTPEPAGTDSPTPSDTVIAGELPLSVVEGSLPTRFQAEEWGLDWEAMHEAATSLGWRAVRAAGVVQAAACTGSGTPTVVYLNGDDVPAAQSWASIAVAQSETNRVCVFDRPGVGLSVMRPDPQTPVDLMTQATEMHALLEALDEPGPYVLVGWSWGGLIARAAGTVAPDDVAGMVLVDHTSPLAPWLLDEGVDGVPGLFWEGSQGVDLSGAAQSVGAGPDLGDRPVIVLQRGDRTLPPDVEIDWEEEDRNQLQATEISTNSLHAVVDDSDHSIPIRNPQAVIAATTAVSESVRAGNAPLGDCPPDLAAAEVTCTAP